MDIGNYGKHASTILIYLLDHGKVRIRDFSVLKISTTTYYKTLDKLEKANLIQRKEVINRRKFVYITLTPEGRKIAIQLKRVQEVAESPNIQLSEEELEKAKDLTLLYHVNVLDDHVTVEELHHGIPPRVFNIYIKRNGGDYFRLWCEYDNSFDCWHARAAWGYPQVQAMIMNYKGKARVCHSCGYENPENAVYCMKCGTKLE